MFQFGFTDWKEMNAVTFDHISKFPILKARQLGITQVRRARMFYAALKPFPPGGLKLEVN